MGAEVSHDPERTEGRVAPARLTWRYWISVLLSLPVAGIALLRAGSASGVADVLVVPGTRGVRRWIRGTGSFWVAVGCGLIAAVAAAALFVLPRASSCDAGC